MDKMNVHIPSTVTLTLPFVVNLLLVTLTAVQFSLADSDDLLCKDGQQCRNGTDTKNTVVKPQPSHPRGRGKAHPENYILVPPFLIGASTVIVLYVIFHCIYMHCYTERRVKKITKKAQRPPTIIIHDDANTGSSQPFTPMVKMEGSYGKNEIVQAQPFLICQPLDEDDDEYCESMETAKSKSKGRRNSSLRKSIQSLQVPNLFASKRKSFSSGSCSENDGSPTEGKPNLERTRASICFVPVGKTINDASNSSNTEWTPLQGFVYSSFVLSRNPSYKQACAATSETSINSEDGHGSYIVLPRKASYCRSISQCSATSLGEETEELLNVNRHNGAVRQNSRVSFSINVDQLKEEDETPNEG